MEILHREFLDIQTPSCHAGTIAFYKNKPVYAWFGGTREGMADCCIYLQREGKVFKFHNQFSALNNITHNHEFPCWNPILFEINDRLFLFFKAGNFCDRWSSLYVEISNVFDDDFEPPNEYNQLPAGLNFCVKTKPIIRKNLIYCGSSVETMINWSSYIEVYAFKNEKFEYIERSRPLIAHQKTYKDLYGEKETMGIIQPSLWIGDKNLHAFYRSSNGLNKIYHSSSHRNSSGSVIWKDPVETQFGNPNSGMDTVYANHKLFLVHNPSDTYRYPLVISELDKEFNVIKELVVRDKTEGVVNTQELSYPYMVEHDGKLHLVYTYGRSKIEAVTIQI